MGRKRKLSDGVDSGAKKKKGVDNVVYSGYQNKEKSSSRLRLSTSQQQQVDVFDREGMTDIFKHCFLQYMTRKDKKTLRLVNWNLYNLVTDNDESFRMWHINMNTSQAVHNFPQFISKLPAFLYESTTEVALTFPVIGEIRTRKNKEEWKCLTDFLVALSKDRLKGFNMDIHDFDKLKTFFDIPTLKVIRIGKFDCIRPKNILESGQIADVDKIIISLIDEARHNLEILMLGSLEFSETGSEAIVNKLPKLKRLTFGNCSGKQILASLLNKTSKLKELNIHYGDLSYLQNVDKEFDHLRTLMIDAHDDQEDDTDDDGVDQNDDVTAESLGIKNLLSKCRGLDYLQMMAVDLDEIDFTADTFSLKQLKLLECSGSSERLKSVLTNVSPKIEVFHEDFMQLGDEFKNLKLNFPGLKELCWNGPNIIKMAKNLQSIDIHTDMLTSDALVTLRKCQLKTVKLLGNLQQMSATGASRLLADHATTLEHVRLTDLGLVQKKEAFTLSKVKVLEICDCSGKLDGILKTCPNIEVLRVRRNLSCKCIKLELQCSNISLPALRELHLFRLTALDSLKKILASNLKKC